MTQDITVAQVWMTDQPQIVLDLRRDKAKGLQNLPREQYVIAFLNVRPRY
jgi:hypothetical protein